MAKDGKSLLALDGLSRINLALKNASVIARYGRLEPRTGTVYYIANENTNYRLRCYETRESSTDKTPVILVPPLMISADVFDVAADNSAVSYLSEQGYSVWLVDFGSPENQEGGLEKDLSDHVLAVNEAIDFVYAKKRKPVHLAGYCQGGIFCYLATAFRQSKDVASIITFGAPVNIYKNFLPGVPDEVTTKVFETAGKVFPRFLTPSVIPAKVTKNLFKLMSPTKEVKRTIEFLGSLHDRDALLATEEGRSFLGGEGFVAWPGPALHEFLRQMLIGNRLVAGGCIIEGRTISLSEITCPILVIYGSHDEIARTAAVKGIADAVPNAELFEMSVIGGHMAIVVGSRALNNTWPGVAQWVDWQEGNAEQPQGVQILNVNTDTPTVDDSSEDALPTALMKTAFGLSKGAIGTVSDLFGITSNSLKTISGNFSSRISYLSQLENLNSDSRVGFALALAEQAEKAPQATYFLYDGRAHSYQDANKRVDNIVRGLISIGVRTGDHVGIVMHARPSSLATIMAVNRLGAVAVCLRNIGSNSQLATELQIGRVQHLIADPENAETAGKVFAGQVHVLGGFGRSQRELPAGVHDMEKIDPSRVGIPDWYSPSPGKADNTAFILFSGRGNTTHCDYITNRRWALSALGTASATALVASDTAYCWTPLHDPTGLLVSVSASLIAGARVAVAGKFDASTFWKEARGYGARVVFYSGCMLRKLVDTPTNKLETGHSIRLFAGVGMPEPLCNRILQRFPTTRVMEIFVSRDTNAYLANISCKKPGPVVETVPGSSDIALVYWDHQKNQPFYDAAGYLCHAPAFTAGMLLAKTEANAAQQYNQPVHNVFEKGDCWQVSGDIFMLEDEGQYRFLDSASNMIKAKDDYLPSLPIENKVWQLECISLAAAYGLSIDGYDHEIPAVAISLRDKSGFSVAELSELVVKNLDIKNRPVIIRIVDKLPMTLGQQVRKQTLREEGLPATALARGRSYWLNPQTEKYVPLNKTSLQKMKKALIAGDPEAKPQKKVSPKSASKPKLAPRKKAGPKPNTKVNGKSVSSGNKTTVKKAARKKTTRKRVTRSSSQGLNGSSGPEKVVAISKSIDLNTISPPTLNTEH
jgi:putative long chain acyl-CoA synthase